MFGTTHSLLRCVPIADATSRRLEFFALEVEATVVLRRLPYRFWAAALNFFAFVAFLTRFFPDALVGIPTLRRGLDFFFIAPLL